MITRVGLQDAAILEISRNASCQRMLGFNFIYLFLIAFTNFFSRHERTGILF